MTSVQKPSWRHHHAPQFYLSKWTDSKGELCLTRRVPTGKLIESQARPKSTGYEEHLYSTPPTTPWERWAPGIVETSFLSPLDNAAALVHEKLLGAPGGVVDLDGADRLAWARFLRSLMERHPRVLAQRDARANQIAAERMETYRAQFNSRRARRALDNFNFGAAAKMIVRNHMVQQIDDSVWLDALLNQEWLVLDAVDADYITSDRPLLENPWAPTSEDKTIYAMTLPLSARRLFVTYPRSWAADPDWQQVLAVLTSEVHNMVVVDSDPQYLYSAKPIENGKYAQLRTMVERVFGCHGADPSI
ncbi:MAG: DUF4238 domain-containing protein [Labilithrix sp.]|nr:DUF4238 domain-containing protein [Labilithrix sp.]MCW5811607.1 DUF4238 domain-containing protein [Labilithrix sp.]